MFSSSFIFGKIIAMNPVRDKESLSYGDTGLNYVNYMCNLLNNSRYVPLEIAKVCSVLFLTGLSLTG